MTKIEAAARSIKAAGYDQLARDFRRLPQYREKIALIVSRDVTLRLGAALGERLEVALLEAAR